MVEYPVNIGRTKLRKNSGADLGKATRHNLIEGTGVSITANKDELTDEFDITIAGHDRAHNLGTTGDHPDVDVAGQAAGDIIRRSADNLKWQRLAIGNPGDVLLVSGGLPVWQAGGGGGLTHGQVMSRVFLGV